MRQRSTPTMKQKAPQPTPKDPESDEAEIEPLVGVPPKRVFEAQTGSSSSNIPTARWWMAVVVLVVLAVAVMGGARSFLGALSMATTWDKTHQLHVATWNVAAINNNPFEYWITYNDEYEQLMQRVEQFLEEPGARDVPVSQVFTEAMFQELDHELTKTAGWKSMTDYWTNDYSQRKIVSQFLKDPVLGSKRLASMPDRITNVINTADGKSIYRPTVISMYEATALDTLPQWWQAWKNFLFATEVTIKAGEPAVHPYQLLKPISPVKYPEITAEEATDSLPLQTLCGAIFDAILVHMMNTLADSPQSWQALKKTMVAKLNKQKNTKTVDILVDQYRQFDILCLQEVSNAMVEKAKQKLGNEFHVITSHDYFDHARDQNSVILLQKSTFPDGVEQELTGTVMKNFDDKVPVEKGDLLVVTAKAMKGDTVYTIASFHGDTNGLATKRVVTGVHQAVPADTTLVFGLDANTYEHAKPKKQQDVLDFAASYNQLGLTSCWGDTPNPSNYTTFNARTFVQPQLQKGCKSDEKRKKGDVNPKDFILFPKHAFARVIQTWKDNTGKRTYTENMAFPTLDFPSDHGILATVLELPKESSQEE